MDFPAPYTRTVPHTQTAPSYIPVAPMHLNFSILASCPPRPALSCGRPAQAATRTHQTPPGNSQKTAKSAIPHLTDHTLQPMPCRSPCTPDSYTGHAPIRFHGSLIRPPSSKKSDTNSAETSVRFTQTYAFNQLTRIPCTNDVEAGAGAWRRLATRRRRRHRSGPCIQARLKAGSCGADPRGTGVGWTRQKSAGRRPDRASCWGLGS